jgi:hypothetical protein
MLHVDVCIHASRPGAYMCFTANSSACLLLLLLSIATKMCRLQQQQKAS